MSYAIRDHRSRLCSNAILRQLVPHLVALGGDVAGVVLVDRADDRHLIDHFQVEAAVDEGVGLLGIVRQQPDLERPRSLRIWMPTP